MSSAEQNRNYSTPAIVTGIGMVSSAGPDVITSCASARAGITRASALGNLRVLDPDTEELEAVTGHTVLGVTEGYFGLGRLVRLGSAGIKDLISKSGLTNLNNTGLFVNLSSDFYLTELERSQHVGADKDDIERTDGYLPKRIGIRQRRYSERLISSLLKHCDLSIDLINQKVVFGDQTGIIKLIRLATKGLERNQFERCIIGGIDSYVEADTIRALSDFGILKTPIKGIGLMPGESASFVLIEREDVAGRRKANILGKIESFSEVAEPFNRLSDEVPLGVALTEAITTTLDNLNDKGDQTGLIIGNLNGDPYRASDWGHAIIRLRAKYPWIDLPEWYPAVAFGEIGAATGFVATCMAIKGFARDYAGTDNVLVWLSSDCGKRGAFYIRKYS
jgi:3-oxoacyl-(acyl-carrier-protein) synthase